MPFKGIMLFNGFKGFGTQDREQLHLASSIEGKGGKIPQPTAIKYVGRFGKTGQYLLPCHKGLCLITLLLRAICNKCSVHLICSQVVFILGNFT
jgi:hypothetical protein